MRAFNLLVLALLTGLAAGCSTDGAAVQEIGSFFPGFVDGFLILFKFLGGYFSDAAYFDKLQVGSFYQTGFITGATAFITSGTLLSLP
jgi:hypothetical protein